MVYKTFVEMFAQHYQNVENVSDTYYENDFLMTLFTIYHVPDIFKTLKHFNNVIKMFFKCLENILEML